ncbi:MAG: putative hydroxymethylpyrimidine transporter CytX [Desulfocucumaceae bacterium]
MELNKIKNYSMFLLWAGAAISISEIYAGGMIAPLGLQKGLLAIVLGHIIGTGLLAFGGYISFRHKKNAMEIVKHSMGSWGVKLIAFLNVLQLIGWAAIMMIQGGRALNYVFPGLPASFTVFIMAAVVFLWVYYFSNYSKWINDISVILLVLLCAVLFLKIGPNIPVILEGHMSFATAVELSIAMPVSWLPLIGDYTKNAKSKAGASGYTFFGYFLGSVMMYSLGLFIAVYSGKDIIEFISSSYAKWLACIVIVLSTATTTFLDIYSAVISSKQIFNIKRENLYVISYSVIATVVAYLFPIEQYQNFLLIIGSVFVPIYTVILLEYLLGKEEEQGVLNVCGILSALAGTIVYFLLTKYEIGIPTILVVCAVSAMYIVLRKILTTGRVKNEGKCS